MRLLLVRHAEAVPTSSDATATDFHRQLTDLGRHQAAVLAERLSGLNLGITVVVSSPFVRAVETAEKLVERLTPGQEFVVTERLASGELKPKKLSKLVFELGGTPVLVGHMPDLAEYAAWLLDSEPEAIEFDKAAVACLNCRHQIARGAGVLEWLVPPQWFLPTTPA
jgi:phosphohistidine phosphatase